MGTTRKDHVIQRAARVPDYGFSLVELMISLAQRARQEPGHATQRGSALFIALALLFMISIMGVIVMQSSTMEHRMATNAIESKAVFRAAESATELALNSESNLSAAFEAGVGQHTTVRLSLDQNWPITGEAELRYAATGIVAGSSLGVFQGLRYIAADEGSFAGIATAGVAQGAVRDVPDSRN